MGSFSDTQGKIDRAIALRAAGRHDDAKELLAEILAAEPDSGLALVALGSLLWDAGDLHAALERIRRATELCPRLEAASLAAFHILWQLERRDEAFDEMRRFLRISDSQEYRRLIWELKHERCDQDD